MNTQSEIEIELDVLESNAQRILIEVDRLNNLGNTPDENYYKIFELLNEWSGIKCAIASIENVIHCIKSNKENNHEQN